MIDSGFKFEMIGASLMHIYSRFTPGSTPYPTPIEQFLYPLTNHLLILLLPLLPIKYYNLIYCNPYSALIAVGCLYRDLIGSSGSRSRKAFKTGALHEIPRVGVTRG